LLVESAPVLIHSAEVLRRNNSNRPARLLASAVRCAPHRALDAARLRRWFRQHKRDLPWRQTRDPYRIWISEIMLQQTQVKTVIPFYERWMRQYPDLASLAAAPLARVLKTWEGLGYYSRAKNLHAAARKIAREQRGQFPRNFAEVLSLPGVGRSTAGAICSIAFGARAPVLDGNVRRVLCRVFGIRQNARAAPTQKRLWRLAESLLPAKNVGQFNESLMELGALVCRPQNPRCESCPLRDGCAARQAGAQSLLPNLGARAAARKVARAAVLARRRGKVLLCRNRNEKLLGDLWRLPFVETGPNETPARLQRRFADELCLWVRLWRPVATLRHCISTSRVTLTAWETGAGHNVVIGAPRNGIEWQWCDARALRRLAMDAATKRILQVTGLDG
jgi:A/G-specific adenine glycosylase